MSRIITFGEIMLRLSSPGHARIVQSEAFDVCYGGGEAFSGGMIHGLLTMPTQGEALEFAVAASALKHTIPGDFNMVSREEVEALAKGSGNGRVQR